MSLCRYLPTPSDRMAVMWTLLGVKDAVVLEYGPAGTTHYSMEAFGSMGISPNQTLFTTHMSEDDVIMGDVTRLENAIIEIEEQYAPKVIFVVASAITAVIGTDLIGVCTYMQERVKARLIAMENGGFKGDYTVGLREVFSMLAKNLSLEMVEKKDCSYNILGASAGSYRIHSDVNEIKRLMSEGFCYQANAIVGLNCSVEQLEQLGSVSLNLVLREEALPMAKWLEETYGTPYLYGVPYGYQGTEGWLQKVAKIINTPISKTMQEELAEGKKHVMSYRRYAMMYRQKEHPPIATLVGEYNTILGLSEACSEIGLPIDTKICLHTLKDIEAVSEEVVYFEREKQRIDKLRSLSYHFVLADEISLHLCNETNYGVCVSFPLVQQSQIAKHLPWMGTRGMDYLLEHLDRYFSTLE